MWGLVAIAVSRVVAAGLRSWRFHRLVDRLPPGQIIYIDRDRHETVQFTRGQDPGQAPSERAVGRGSSGRDG
jgi:hypothetical protein